MLENVVSPVVGRACHFKLWSSDRLQDRHPGRGHALWIPFVYFLLLFFGDSISQNITHRQQRVSLRRSKGAAWAKTFRAFLFGLQEFFGRGRKDFGNFEVVFLDEWQRCLRAGFVFEVTRGLSQLEEKV